MSNMHLALVAVGLFVVTFLSPGPNLLVVVRSSLVAGRVAGFAAGAGVAAGDAIYAALGLFGMAALVAEGGALLHAIKIVGGVYLMWFGIGLICRRTQMAFDQTGSGTPAALGGYFVRGLMTDLANPQTILFFASIFAITLRPDTPMWAKLVAWTGIVLTSLLWRLFLSVAFSREGVRRGYRRAQQATERVVGVGLAAFGARLIYQGLRDNGSL